MFRKSTFSLAIFLLGIGIAQTQPKHLQFEHYDLSSGLASDQVFSIFKDSWGFMWFCTSDGLSRFDGSTFVNYRYDPQDSTSISNSYVSAIHEDSNGYLWLGTDRGLNRFDRKSQIFTRFFWYEDRKNWLSHSKIMDIAEDRDGYIWLATYGGGLNRYDPQTNTFKAFRYQESEAQGLDQDFVITVYADENNFLWLGLAGKGLHRFDIKNESFDHFVFDSGSPDMDFRKNVVRDIYESGDSLWISSYGGLTVFDKTTSSFVASYEYGQEADGLSSSSVHSARMDEQGRVWVATSGGLDYLDPTTGQVLKSWEKQANRIGGLKSSILFDLLYDPQGSLWVAGFDGGIHRGHLGKKEFFLVTNDNSTSPSKNDITTISEINNGVLVTAGGDIFQYEAEYKALIPFEELSHIPKTIISDLVRDRTQKIWVGSERSGLLSYDPANGEIREYTYSRENPSSLGYNVVYDLLEDQEGTLWIASLGGGLNRYEPLTDSFTRFWHDREDSSSVSSNRVARLFQAKNGDLWVGTSNGLNRYNFESKDFVRHSASPGSSDKPWDYYVFDILQDRNGFLWVATRKGLLKYSEIGERVVRFTAEDGLPSNEIHVLIEDQSGVLWLGTGFGLCKFYPETEEFRKYDKYDGVPVNRFNSSARSLLGDGTILIGTDEGLMAFHPNNIVDNHIPPPIVITQFEVYGEKPTPTSRNIFETIRLNYREDVFNITYAALNYNASAKNQYAYRLEGFDRDWIAAGNRRFVTYTNLSPGKYTFRVKGSNNDGIWNEEGASLNIQVIPPPWSTWWAYSIYVIVTGIIVGGFIHYRVREVRLRNDLAMEEMKLQKLQEMDQIKSRFIANVSHELRTPLTLVLGPLKEYASGLRESGGNHKMFSVMHRNGQKLLRLINQLLDISKLESGVKRLQVSENDIVQFVKVVFANFSSLADQKGITYTLSYDSEPVGVYFDTEELEKAIGNVLSNAMKFTASGGRVSVHIEKEHDSVTIRIKDSGIGIPSDKVGHIFDRFYQVDNLRTRRFTGTGIGLAIAKELVELHHGEINVESQVGKGTSFSIKLLLGSSHFKPEEITESALPYHDKNVEEIMVEDHIPPDPADISEDASVVLVVEDNPDMRYYLRDIIGDRYKIIEANDGFQGIELAIETIPDLIITDVMMPRLDGLEFCRKIKADSRTSHIPVIMVTAKVDDEHQMEGFETGADAYLTKPFRKEELEIRVEKLIQQRKKLIEKFSKILTARPNEVSSESVDERFLREALEVIERNLSNSEFDVDTFRQEMALSRVQLYRKIKALTNYSASEFIRNIRIKRAAQLLKRKEGTISDVAYSVGFNNLSYFSKCFREEFHRTPSEYMKEA